MAAAVRLIYRMKINPRFNPKDKKCLGLYGGCYFTCTNSEVIGKILNFPEKKGLFLLL